MPSVLPAPGDVRTTALHALHLELGARMAPFAGYDMPVQYPQGLIAEHRHTREKVSLFDVSHMGIIRVSGEEAASALERILPIDVVDLQPHRLRYALLLNETGCILDDLMVIHTGTAFWLIVNASRKHEDVAWIAAHIGHLCRIEALTDMGMLALQGPMAAAVLHGLQPSIAALGFMQGMPVRFQGAEGYVTRSGYTGEDGFEIALPVAHIESLARWLLRQPHVQPAGLGARNTLRLEAGLCLYGSDMDSTTTPAQAGLNWSISKARRTGGARAGGFVGASTVLAQLEGSSPIDKLRVGLHAMERIPVRDGTPLHLPEGAAVGIVTSGSLSPSLDRPIALGYLPPAHSAFGTPIHAMVRGKPVPMEIVPLPFMATRYRKA